MSATSQSANAEAVHTRLVYLVQPVENVEKKVWLGKEVFLAKPYLYALRLSIAAVAFVAGICLACVAEFFAGVCIAFVALLSGYHLMKYRGENQMERAIKHLANVKDLKDLPTREVPGDRKGIMGPKIDPSQMTQNIEALTVNKKIVAVAFKYQDTDKKQDKVLIMDYQFRFKGTIILGKNYEVDYTHRLSAAEGLKLEGIFRRDLESKSEGKQSAS